MGLSLQIQISGWIFRIERGRNIVIVEGLLGQGLSFQHLLFNHQLDLLNYCDYLSYREIELISSLVPYYYSIKAR